VGAGVADRTSDGSEDDHGSADEKALALDGHDCLADRHFGEKADEARRRLSAAAWIGRPYSRLGAARAAQVDCCPSAPGHCFP